MMIYFDHNATSPLHPAARQAWLDACENFIGNPSSPHRIGSRADAALSEARQKLAGILQCDALDIVWTSGATESNNMAIHHFASALNKTEEIWVSAIEHPCVIEATKHFFAGRHRMIPVLRDGRVDLDWLRREMLKRRPGAVVVMAANNETGVLQPWREVQSMCRENGMLMFCDATQWVGKMPSLGLGNCDFVSGSAHKFGGPKGVGFLKCPPKGRVQPLLRGGQQEEGRRAGTENVPGILAMMAALEVREAALRSAQSRDQKKWPMEELRSDFERRLLAQLPGTDIVGMKADRLWNTVSAVMPDADCRQRWVVKLDKLGFAVSTGSACASGKEDPSHVIAAMGFSPAESGRVLRFSSGWETTREEWAALLEALEDVWSRIRNFLSLATNRKPAK